MGMVSGVSVGFHDLQCRPGPCGVRDSEGTWAVDGDWEVPFQLSQMKSCPTGKRL